MSTIDDATEHVEALKAKKGLWEKLRDKAVTYSVVSGLAALGIGGAGVLYGTYERILSISSIQNPESALAVLFETCVIAGAAAMAGHSVSNVQEAMSSSHEVSKLELEINELEKEKIPYMKPKQ
ncbi:MAG: hypothetical protein V1702_01320 [Candidatus Woesearchaeota archaeon]